MHPAFVVGACILNVTGIVGISNIVPIWNKFLRIGELYVRDVVCMPAIPTRWCCRPYVAGWKLILRLQRISVSIAFGLDTLWLSILNVCCGQGQVPRTAIHLRVVGPGSASYMSQVCHTNSESRLFEVPFVVVEWLRSL